MPPPLTSFDDDRTRQLCAECQMQTLRRLVDSGNADAHAFPYLHHLYLDYGAPDNLAGFYIRWIETQPSNSIPRLALAGLLLKEGNPDAALQQLILADRATPDNPAVLSELGAFYGRTQRFPLAEDYFRRALRLNDRYAPAHAGLGIISAATGNRQAAILHFRTALQLDPSLENARAALARLQSPTPTP